MIYLATPYSDPDPEVMEQRYQAVTRAAAELMVQGHLVFSPITHNHPLIKTEQIPHSWKYWAKYDEEMIASCSHFCIYITDGWKQSEGVLNETLLAMDLQLPLCQTNGSDGISRLGHYPRFIGVSYHWIRG